MGTAVLRGSGFSGHDTASWQHVAVINEAFAEKFLPNTDPIGQHFGKGDASHAGDYEIVGVVKAAKYRNAARPPQPMFFVPLAQTEHYDDADDERVELESMYMGTVELHVAGDPASYHQAIRRMLTQVDPNLIANDITTFDEQIAERTTDKTMMSRLTGLFGLVALLLASIGLYGLTAYQVARRTSEIGIRMALGANRLSILRLVLNGAFLQVAVGLALGIPLVYVAGRLIANQLFDPPTFRPLTPPLFLFVLAL